MSYVLLIWVDHINLLVIFVLIPIVDNVVFLIIIGHLKIIQVLHMF